MFLKLSENLEKTLPMKRTYKGIVVENNDPEKLGRVKCTVQGIFEGDTANLPWITPQRSDSLGGNADSGVYAIPEIGSYLEIKFPTEDVYSPFYYGYWEDANTHQSEFDTDYPDTYGFKDSTGTKVVINKKQKTFDFEHASGVKMSVDGDGNLTMTIPKDFGISTENLNLEANADAKIDAGGNAEITAGGDVKAEGDGTGSFKGTGGTTVGDASSATSVDGSVVNLAGGGAPVARLGDTAVGVGVYGVPVTSTIVSGSGKVTSA